MPVHIETETVLLMHIPSKQLQTLRSQLIVFYTIMQTPKIAITVSSSV